MSLGKLIKTGLAIYGGAVLAGKMINKAVIKNEEKIKAWFEKKISAGIDKIFDDAYMRKPAPEANVVINKKGADAVNMEELDALMAALEALRNAVEAVDAIK